jgi:Cd2+/Zn2+-exporting ATPase
VQAERPQLRSWLDTFGEAYSKAVILASLAALAALLLTGVPLLSSTTQRGAAYRAMGLLTVASPCALVLAPMAYVSAIAAAASRGLLLKGGRVLDALHGCRSVAFDKTGTLTTGSLVCTSMQRLPQSGSSAAAEGLRAAAAAMDAAVALSLRSTHPVSEAVVMLGDGRGSGGRGADVSAFELVAGSGVEGMVAGGGIGSTGVRAVFGSLDYVGARLSATEVEKAGAYISEHGSAAVYSVLLMEPTASTSSASAGGGAAGEQERSVWVFSFQDSVRQQSASAIAELQTVSVGGYGCAYCLHACL